MKAKSKKKRTLRQPENRLVKQPAKHEQPGNDNGQLLTEKKQVRINEVKPPEIRVPDTETKAINVVPQKEVRGRLKLSKKASEVLLQEISELKNEELHEKTQQLVHGDGVCTSIDDSGNPHCDRPVKRRKKLFLKLGWLMVAACVCAIICIWPSQGIERYLTKRQCARIERLVESRDFRNGLAYLDEIKEGREGDYLYWMYRGVCNAGVEYNRQEAEQNYLHALSLCKEQHEIYEVKYYLASLCNDLGRYDETRAICLEALSRVRKWKPGARERYEALLNRSDVNQETQKLQEAAQRGDWLKHTDTDTLPAAPAEEPVIVPEPEIVNTDSVVLAKKDTVPENEDLAALEASAREMLKNMGEKGKKVDDIVDLLPEYDKNKKTEEKIVLPPPPKPKKETEAERVRWIRDMKLVIGKDTLLIIQGSDSLVAVVKRIAKVEKEPDGGLVYVIPDDEIVEVDGLEKLLDKKVTVMIYEVFDFNKVYMNNRGHLFMDKLVSLLDGRPDIQLEVAVHCDGIGTQAVNRRVAEMRMVGIRDRLEKKDIPTGRIHFEICGSDRPRQITDREARLYPFFHVGDVLTMEYLQTMEPEQRRIGHMLNRRVELRKMN